MSNKVTAGRDFLGDFAPDFAKYNDDILFGEVWANDILSPKERSITTITALVTKGSFEQLGYHLSKGRENGTTKEEVSALITQLTFYVGWPNAWSAFNIVKEVWRDNE